MQSAPINEFETDDFKLKGGENSEEISQEEESAGVVGYFRTLYQAFGWRILLLLTLTEAGLKGFAAGGGSGGLVGLPIEYLLKEFHVSAGDIQIYKAAIVVPWSIKPLLGLTSDSVPIFGYHRLPYFALVCAAGTTSCLLIGLYRGLSLSLLLILLFLIFLMVAWSDLLTEAIYSTVLRKKPEHGPSLISYVWGGIGVGRLLSLLFVGEVLKHFGNHASYLIAAPVAALALLVPFMNLPEEKRTKKPCCAKLCGTELPLAIVALITGIGTLSLALLSIFGGSMNAKVIAAAVLAVVALGVVSLVLNPIIAKMNAFFFIMNICCVSISGAQFYFFTDGPDQYPEGPHLSQVFYTSAIGLACTVFSLLGMVVYNRWMQHWNYPQILMVGNLLSAGTQMLSCLVYSRWNLKLGINDHIFVLGSDAIQSVVQELAWLPTMLLISQLCPKGCEATMFALLAGMSNLGASLGSYFGAYMLVMLGVKPTGADNETHQFDNLWIASAISSLLPLLPLILVYQLIPNVGQKDSVPGLKSSTHGSPLNKFLIRMGWMEEDEPSSSSEEIEESVEMQNLARGQDNASDSDQDAC
mmetsp:Transcript_27335/g.63644  ORF Transcript_27335/g.63644 Transcript_27335/m.63644 type:complete len:583 (-) Transcript_27335:119-1867(-)